MLSFEEFLIKYLPGYIKENDTYKDSNQKGFIERYFSIFGAELDSEYYGKVESIIDLVDPFNTSSEFLDEIATILGDLENHTTSEAQYRRLLSFIISIYKIKGTLQSFKSILRIIPGLEVSITELTPINTIYDDPSVYYDDGVTIYDDTCVPCSDYDIQFTYGSDITSDLYLKTLKLIKLVEPIHANTRNYYWNGGLIVETFIDVTVDENGDLIYDNSEDPDLILTLDEFGNLIISGPNADRYYINSNGDLIYLSSQ